MTTVVLAALLIVHGLNHLVVWLPLAPYGAAGRTAFGPEQAGTSATLVLPTVSLRRVAGAVAVGTAGTFVLAGLAVGFGLPQAVPLAVVGATVGLLLKAPYFHTRLALGAAVDLLVLAVALDSWPLALVQG